MYELPRDKNQIVPNVFHKACPARYLLDIVSDKWSFLIIDALEHRQLRNGELMRLIEGISQKMLTQTLRKLEKTKLVVRHDLQTKPLNVAYQLTPIGLSLRKKVCEIDRWVEDNMMEILPDDLVNYV